MIEKKDKALLVVQGLGDRTKFLMWLLTTFTSLTEHLDIHPLSLKWGDREHSVEQKRALAIQEILRLREEYEKVYVLGISAAVSIILSIAIRRPELIDKFIAFNGPVRLGKKGVRYVPNLKWLFPVLDDAVRQIEAELNQLDERVASSVLTVTAPRYADELIDPEMATIPGSEHRRIFAFQHWLITNFGIVVYHKLILEFLNLS